MFSLTCTFSTFPSRSFLFYPFLEPKTGVAAEALSLSMDLSLYSVCRISTTVMKYIPNTWALFSAFSLNFSALDLSFFNRSISLSDDLLFLFSVFYYLYSDSAKASLLFLSSSIDLCNYEIFSLPLALKKNTPTSVRRRSTVFLACTSGGRHRCYTYLSAGPRRSFLPPVRFVVASDFSGVSLP